MVPTPTPFGVAAPAPFSVPNFSLWSYTSWAVTGWQMATTVTTVVQALFLLFLVGYGITFVMKFFSNLTNKEMVSGEEES